MTETALPETVTGAFTSARIWFPLRIPSSPDVTGAVQVDSPLCGSCGGADAPFTTVLSPMTETALPETVTGRVHVGEDLVSAEDSFFS